MYTRIYGDFIYRNTVQLPKNKPLDPLITIPQKDTKKLLPTKFHLLSRSGPQRRYDRLNFRIGIRVSFVVSHWWQNTQRGTGGQNRASLTFQYI